MIKRGDYQWWWDATCKNCRMEIAAGPDERCLGCRDAIRQYNERMRQVSQRGFWARLLG